MTTVFIYLSYGSSIASFIGFDILDSEAGAALGLRHFFTPKMLWFYVYYFVSCSCFFLFWRYLKPTPWILWSIVGSCSVLFLTLLNVQFTVAYNYWVGPFYNLLQDAMAGAKPVTSTEMYGSIFVGIEIYLVQALFFVLNKFLISHYAFRWRTAMNDYYTDRWTRLRNIEGASQRVQEDTMRFARMMEELGVSLVEAILTLLSFLPILANLSTHVTSLPLLGHIPYSLCVASILWSIVGTMLLAILGIKLPGLEFENQKVEAAFRKELVYGEDNVNRADKKVLISLFGEIRQNYFRIYFHYCYFNFGRQMFLNLNWLVTPLLLIPTIVSGAINYGIYTQIGQAFYEVTRSFQYLVKSWPQIVDLLSVYKRLHQFELTLKNKAKK
ncbi:MAG: hypothetical protein MJK18_01540 [Bdellovibrionales bacterium]|nr:hypothetical protein [Bdellovibrionales bacterium]